MKTVIALFIALSVSALQEAATQDLHSNIPYAENPHERQVLDIYSPGGAQNLPVVFWIHGGGWQTGDKTDVQIKPRVAAEQGFIFVSTNYRLLPHVEMEDIIRDVAKSLGWVHKNITRYGGDPTRIFVMGHSAGAQLAALLCTDDRYLKAEKVPFKVLRGCVPVDGDTYDLPAIIASVELSRALHGLPLPTLGHRVKFGNDPEKHIDFSAVTHVQKGKDIPPFFIIHITENPNTTMQAQRLAAVLRKAEIPVTVFSSRGTTHNQVNQNLGLPDDEATMELYRFMEPLM
jgi:acetyl esterase/lipase